VSSEELALAWAVAEADRAKFVKELQGKIGVAHITTKKPSYEIGAATALPLSFAKKKAPAPAAGIACLLTLGLEDCVCDAFPFCVSKQWFLPNLCGPFQRTRTKKMEEMILSMKTICWKKTISRSPTCLRVCLLFLSFQLFLSVSELIHSP